MKVTYSDQKSSLYPKSGRGTGFKTTSGKCARGKTWVEVSGYVETPHGYVSAYSWSYEGAVKTSHISIIKDGFCYRRVFIRALTGRGLVAKSKQFAKDVFTGNVDGKQ